MSVFIIAEAGSTHEGSLDRAWRLVNVAYNCGADACKFQYCSNLDRLLQRRKVTITTPAYPFSIKREWLPILKESCAEQKIEFMCSTYLPEDIEVVAPYVERFKISAFESKDQEFINAHKPYKKFIIASSADANEIKGVDYVLYCVSKYPCPDEEIKLKRMHGFAGLSDHTKNLLTGVIALGRRGGIIETHFRLDDTSIECPDYVVAKSPDELRQYIKNIRDAEVLLG